MKKLVIFTQNLDIGGVQKSVSTLANYLSKFYTVHIVLAEHNKEIQYQLHSSIDVTTIETKMFELNKKNIGLKIFQYRVCELNKILIKIKPETVLSYEDYNNLILLNTKYKTKKVVSVRVSVDNYKNKKVHLLKEDFYIQNCKKFYKNNKVIVVSKSIQKNIPKSKVIYNGISNKKDLNNNETNYMLNVGRLDPQKGQRDLIEAFNIIKDNITQNLIIVGDGKMRLELEKLIIDLKLQHRIYLVGFDNPYKYYKNASLFIFPSYYEGFPNALIEAMSARLPVISYNFKGSDEILSDRVTLGNIKELASKILFLLKNKKVKEDQLLSNKIIISKLKLSQTLKKYKLEIDKMMIKKQVR